jgi:hypothetical protein
LLIEVEAHIFFFEVLEAGARRRRSKASVDDQMRRAHALFARAFKSHGIPTTPAYDVVGLMAAMGCCGYGFILANLNKYFGVSIRFFKSGKPEHWEPMWDTPAAHDKASATQLFE